MSLAGAIAGASAIGSIASGLIGSQAAAGASAAQVAAEQKAIAAQEQYFGIAKNEEQPFVNYGENAGGQLSALLGIGGGAAQAENTLQNLPGYQFTYGQGQQAENASITARGLGLSGAQIRGASDYAQGAASTNYNNYVNELMGFTSLGAQTAGAVGNQATAVGGNIAGSEVGIGNAQAAGITGQAGALSGGISGVANAGATYGIMSSPYYQAMINGTGSQYQGDPFSLVPGAGGSGALAGSAAPTPVAPGTWGGYVATGGS